jgi:hypothetical protein
MIVTIHQPNLFPWLGFFDKMMAADLFILLDHVPFTKGGYQNRVKLKGSGGEQWLTVPVVTSGKNGQRTNEVLLNGNLPWRRDHIRTLEAVYRGTPHFAEMLPGLKSLYEGNQTTLAEFAIPGIERIRDLLGIGTPLTKASELGVEGSSSELLAGLVEKAGGTVYLSGPSGRNYLDERVFAEKGIRVAYHSFEPFPYPQRFGTFIGGLSALDYLVNAAGSGWWKRGEIA